ncbi:single-stranded-DNA-specific exonuclease RecJ [Reichenbachiella sp. MALMAid0571]|uniref:single-stranded-DNA-specific exonuclease RecJ n=1 Tax=Reichenbachiella sp. MALMAid0571 TaxID=3143939 RepID=UPI0032DF78E4
MIKEWEIPSKDDNPLVSELAELLNVSPIICQLLVRRGVNSFDKAKTFFRPEISGLHDPFYMKDMDKAVARLNDAIFNNEKILIYGDYDVDGTTSVALVYSFLREIYENIDFYIPDRYSEGYGISKQGIDYAQASGTTLIIALDCGIRAIDNVNYANEKFIDFIICDHHLPGDKLPDAVAILDPKRKDCLYPYDELSGCGIGFKFLQGFCLQNTIDLEQLYNYLDLVAVSIASDIVPMTGENRILAWYGLKKLNSKPLPGFKALIDVSGFKNKLDITNVVFGIGPRINAAGRIGHAKSAVELLIAENDEQASTLAKNLNLNNIERKEYDESITLEALAQIEQINQTGEAKSNVLFNTDWHKGIIGIVASRCIEKHYKPTIILTESNGSATGSARSVEGFDIYEAISSCSHLLEQYGGHKYAAGLTMPLANVSEFQMQFEKVVSTTITNDQLIPKIKVDAEIDFADINFSLYNIIKQMGPFGPHNMQPVFATNNVRLKNKARVLKDLHLKLFVEQEGSEVSFDAIGFNLSEYSDKLDSPFSIAYTIEENNYMGNKTLQLVLKDIKTMNQ